MHKTRTFVAGATGTARADVRLLNGAADDELPWTKLAFGRPGR